MELDKITSLIALVAQNHIDVQATVAWPGGKVFLRLVDGSCFSLEITKEPKGPTMRHLPDEDSS